MHRQVFHELISSHVCVAIGLEGRKCRQSGEQTVGRGRSDMASLVGTGKFGGQDGNRWWKSLMAKVSHKLGCIGHVCVLGGCDALGWGREGPRGVSKVGCWWEQQWVVLVPGPCPPGDPTTLSLAPSSLSPICPRQSHIGEALPPEMVTRLYDGMRGLDLPGKAKGPSESVSQEQFTASMSHLLKGSFKEKSLVIMKMISATEGPVKASEVQQVVGPHGPLQLSHTALVSSGGGSGPGWPRSWWKHMERPPGGPP